MDALIACSKVNRKLAKMPWVVASALVLLATLVGCTAEDSDLRMIEDKSEYANVVELGPISARYPDDMVVVKQYEPAACVLFGEDLSCTQTTVLFGDPEDYRMRFNLMLCEGVSLADVEAHAAVAEQRARDRAKVLEGASETSEHMGDVFANAASVASRTEYAAPERVLINGDEGLVWYSTVPGEEDSFVNMMYLVEVDEDTTGLLLAGYMQSVYDEDPAYWDDVFSTLRVG